VREVSDALTAVVRELETHASELGWDQPARIYALVPTAQLVAQEPGLAEALGLEADDDGLTPVEQEPLAEGQDLEDVLAGIEWPDDVSGVAAVAERLVLPPGADGELPQDPQAAQDYAATHPDRQEVRMVAAALRGGESACALRLRSHDADDLVLTGPHLVPGLLEQLHATLEPEETARDE
jgi:hypothetical protein